MTITNGDEVRFLLQYLLEHDDGVGICLGYQSREMIENALNNYKTCNMKTIYILISVEAVDAEQLIEGVFTSRTEVDKRHAELLEDSSGDFWEIVEREINI